MLVSSLGIAMDLYCERPMNEPLCQGDSNERRIISALARKPAQLLERPDATLGYDKAILRIFVRRTNIRHKNPSAW